MGQGSLDNRKIGLKYYTISLSPLGRLLIRLRVGTVDESGI